VNLNHSQGNRMRAIEFIMQLLGQLGITLVGILAGVWAAVTLVSKQWLELEFGRRKEEHKQEIENYYRQHQESFRQELDNYYKMKQEAFRQALVTDYSKELETHKAERQQQIERMKGNIAEELEGTKAGHQLNLEKTKLDLDARKQLLAAEVTSQVETLKSGLDLSSKTRLSNAEKRVDAYRTLWGHMAPLSPLSDAPLDRTALETTLRKWYYDYGSGLFLTWEAQDAYVLATGLLRQKVAEVPDATVRDAFSLLRTQMKIDIAVYTTEEAAAPVG